MLFYALKAQAGQLFAEYAKEEISKTHLAKCCKIIIRYTSATAAVGKTISQTEQLKRGPEVEILFSLSLALKTSFLAVPFSWTCAEMAPRSLSSRCRICPLSCLTRPFVCHSPRDAVFGLSLPSSRLQHTYWFEQLHLSLCIMTPPTQTHSVCPLALKWSSFSLLSI